MTRTRVRTSAVVVAVALVAAACGAAVEGADLEATAGPPDSLPLSEVSSADGVVLAPDPDAAIATTAAPASTTTVPPTTAVPTTTIAPDPFRTWIATAHDDVPHLVAYDEPNGTPIGLPFLVPNPHQFGGPLTLMVTDGQPGDDWLRVQLPIRPNGQEAWIDASDYDVGQTRVRAVVTLSEHHVAVYDGDELIAETEAVIGAESTPTPLGTFYVAAKRRNPEAEYYVGPWALVLSGFSEALETFSGGLPVIAIHGTHRPEQVGQSRSNGCIRVPNDVIEFLAETVPVGAPVVVNA